MARLTLKLWEPEKPSLKLRVHLRSNRLADSEMERLARFQGLPGLATQALLILLRKAWWTLPETGCWKAIRLCDARTGNDTDMARRQGILAHHFLDRTHDPVFPETGSSGLLSVRATGSVRLRGHPSLRKVDFVYDGRESRDWVVWPEFPSPPLSAQERGSGSGGSPHNNRTSRSDLTLSSDAGGRHPAFWEMNVFFARRHE